MADYHSLLAKAVDALDPNTPGARQRIYDRARSAMCSTIESTVPPIHAVDVATARIALEAAITKVEAEAVHRNSPAPTATAPPLSPSSELASSPDERAASLASDGRRSGTKSGRGTWLTEVLERASNGGDAGRSFASGRTRGDDA
jgi:hypothetical protein